VEAPGQLPSLPLLNPALDRRQVFRLGGNAAVDDHSQISFSIPRGTLPWQPVFVVEYGCLWTHAAGGAAGRANVRLCRASSFSYSAVASPGPH